MTWGTDCPQCGRSDCSWANGPICEGNVEQKFATLRARIAELEAERDRLREALEKKGAADVYRDGFDAALRTADSFRAHVEWGPYVTPQNAFNEGVNQLRSVLREARAALTPKPGGTDHERD